MSGRLPILFASSTLEESHLPVRRAVEAMGHEVVLYPVDLILSGAMRYTLDLSASGEVQVTCADRSIGPHDIAAAWYWKPLSFRMPDAELNVAKQLSMVNEMTSLDNSVWGLYPAALWLNSPQSTWLANQKLPQLILASQIGFSVPPTQLTNNWDDVLARFSNSDDTELIAKMHRGVLADHNDIKAAYTTLLGLDRIDQLRLVSLPYPGLLQPFIPKRREWRVSVVYDRVFSGAIYTSAAARDDWRKHQLDPERVQFRSETLPAEVADKCVRFLRSSSLGYGAFDLIETPDGEFFFLECNPSGQFAWLDEQCDLGVAGGIAAALVAIAEQHGRI